MITPLVAQSQTLQLRAKATELEAAFLSEMLKAAGLSARQGDFSGGIGEDQFASFLLEAQAKAMVHAGGIGLSEALFRALGGQDDAS